MMTPERDTPALELAKESTYDRIRKYACVWCARNIPLGPDGSHCDDSGLANWKAGRICAAPTKDTAIESLSAALERARVVLQESANRIDILLLRGDIGVDEKDEQTTKRWLGRLRKALADIGPAELNPHPETVCQLCRQPNIVWFTDNATWNRVMGNDGGILCPTCFVQKAETMGILEAWQLQIEGTADIPAAPKEKTNEILD